MSTLNVVLVGCGAISDAWLKPSIKFDDINIVGLVDLQLENAESCRKKYQLDAAVGIDLAEMLNSVDADIVFDCTIPAAHCYVTVTALEHGCHVLGEKPMAESMADARKMVVTAEQTGKNFAVVQNRRYQDEIVAYRDLIQSDSLGGLTTLNADFYLGAHFDGFRADMEHVLLVDMAIHSFDQARFITGCDPLSVYCHEWNPKGSWYKHGGAAICIFEMDNGVVFSYRGSWCAEGMNTSWQCDWRAVCETGSACWDGEQNITAENLAGREGLLWPQKPVEWQVEKLIHSSHGGVIREFLDAIKSGVKPQTTCTDNIKSLAMVHAAIDSAETGVKVIL